MMFVSNYRKFFLALIITLYLLLNPIQIKGQEYIKFSNNPIIKYDSSISWKSKHVASPFVIYENGVFKMWYDVHNGVSWKIAYATSNDGIIWQDYKINPVITPANDGKENHSHTPKVVMDSNNHYFMYYTASPDDATYFEIRAAESTDGINWSKIKDFSLKVNQAWEHWGLANPMVIKDNSIYHMLYDSHDGSNWRIGYATSNDGLNWNKYQNNPLTLNEGNASGALFVLKDGVKFKGWRHGGSGIPNIIYEVESSDYINWVNKKNILGASNKDGDFDKDMIVAPSAVILGNKTYLYYSGFNGANWQIGLAIKELPVPSKTPVVLIPGFMSSWNRQAILHNEAGTTAGWTMSPFVHEYDGIINSFKNLGYNQDQDFFIYNYDWRKKLDEDADDIKAYLQQKIWNTNPQKKVNIIGHSLGGLVGRIFAQKYNQNNIGSLITVGSSHRGTANVYRAVEGGEIDKSNSWLWLAEKLILTLNKQSFETDKETINQKLPVLKDILPTYDFLKKPNNEFLAINNMQIKNDNLINYNNAEQTVFPYLNTFVGDKGDSLFGYATTDRTTLDRLLNLFPDGRPTENLYDRGDGLILRQSAGIGDKIKTYSQDHGEIIYTKNSIKEILNGLSIPYQENQISEGRATNLSPSLIFLIKSPAQINVVNGGNTYDEQDGIIFIENAQSGDYTLKVKGQQLGRYTLIIGQITPQKDLWSQIEGEISQTPPSSQVDTYLINFNSQSPQSPLSSPINLFDELILILTNLNKTLNQANLTRAIANLNQAKNFNLQNNKGRLKSTLLAAHQQILKLQLIEPAEKLENLYEKLLLNYSSGIIPSRLKRDFDRHKQIITPTQNYLLAQKNKGKTITKNALILKKIDEKLNSAGQALTEKNYNRAEILLKSVEELISEVRKL